MKTKKQINFFKFVLLTFCILMSIRATIVSAASSQTNGYVFQLATIADSTVVGGADIPFSNNGPMSGIFHTAGTTTVIVPNSGCYKIDYNVSITAGVGSQLAVAVNGTVDASTLISVFTNTGEVSGSVILQLAAGDVVTLRNNSAIPLTLALAPSVGAQMSITEVTGTYGNINELASGADATVFGGADIPFSNNGTMSGISHTAGTTTVTVPNSGCYKIDYNASITAGVGACLAVAVNGTVDPSTLISVLTSTGEVSGSVILQLAAGDVVTLRNNSAIPLTLALAPSVGAQMSITEVTGTYGNINKLATIADATLFGGADIPFSNNGSMSGISHNAGNTIIIVQNAGCYKIDYNVSITAGVGAQLAVAVNGTVDPSTLISVLTSTGEVSGSVILQLAAGDIITLRNNSLVPITLALAPSVGAQMQVSLIPPAASSDCDITTWTAPATPAMSGVAASKTVSNGTTSLVVDVAVSANATWKLYSDPGCSTEITNKTMLLNVGANTAYIKVTAEDGTTKAYTVTITRQAAGTATTLVDGLNKPNGVAVDSDGNIYIADTDNNAIKKRDISGAVTTLVDGLNKPYGVAVDSYGNVYIADTYNNAIKKRDTTGTVTTLVDGLNRPFGVAVDSDGNVYITDTNNVAVKKRDTSGTITTLPAPNDGYGWDTIIGVAVDSDKNVYIADENNYDVTKIDTSGTVTKLMPMGPYQPYGIAVDSEGNVYISDIMHNAIKKRDISGAVTTLVDGLNQPSGVAVDSEGNVYIADTNNNAIKKITVSNQNSAVLISNDSVTGIAAGNATITGLDSTKTYNVQVVSGTDNGKYVSAVGVVGASVVSIKGVDEITGLVNGTTYKVVEAAPTPATLTAGKGLVRIMTGKPQYANAKIPFVIDSQSFFQNPTGYSFDVIYDPTKVGTLTVDSFNGLTKPTIGTPAADGSKEKVTVSWNGTFTGDLDAIYDSSKGVLFKLNFVAEQAFTSGETPIEIGTGGSVTFSSGNSSITGTSGKIISGIIYGDVNGDGAITSSDTNLINKYVSGKITAILGDLKQAAADVNGDGIITAADAKEISNYISGKASTLKTLFGY